MSLRLKLFAALLVTAPCLAPNLAVEAALAQAQSLANPDQKSVSDSLIRFSRSRTPAGRKARSLKAMELDVEGEPLSAEIAQEKISSIDDGPGPAEDNALDENDAPSTETDDSHLTDEGDQSGSDDTAQTENTEDLDITAQPDVPDTPEDNTTPDQPTEPDQPQDNNNEPPPPPDVDKPETPETPDQPQGEEDLDITAQPDVPDTPGDNTTPDRPAEPDQPQDNNNEPPPPPDVDKPDTPETPDQPQGEEDSDITAEPDVPDTPEDNTTPDQPAEPDQPQDNNEQPAPPDADQPGDNSNLNTPDGAPDVGAVIGMQLSLQRTELEQNFAPVAADLIYMATIQTGNKAIVTTGTVTQSGDQFTYSPGPNDALVLKLASGDSVTYKIEDFRGDFSQSSGTLFMREDHSVKMQIATSWGHSVQISLLKQNGAYQNLVNGVVSVGKEKYKLNTKTVGKVVDNSSSTGIEYKVEETVTGQSSSKGVVTDLKESLTYAFVRVDTAVEDINKTFNNRWKVGDSTYILQGGHVFRTFKNGLPAELNSWSAKGQVTKNGKVVGKIGFLENNGVIETVLQVEGKQVQIFADKTR